MTEDETLQDMRLIFEADKNAGDPTGWRPSSGPDGLVMTLPLDVLSQTIGTAWLSFRAVQRKPEMDASISLITTLQGRDLRTWRMDWRPIHPHTNTCGPKDLRGLTSHTGIHDFPCNAKLGLLRMQAEDLPLCIPVADDPHDFDAFVRYALRQLRVSPTEPIPGPPWSATLF